MVVLCSLIMKSLLWTGQEKLQFNNWQHAYWMQLYHPKETLIEKLSKFPLILGLSGVIKEKKSGTQ